MKITRIVDLHADAGWRVFSFLKIETDAGVVGWSEYNESYGSEGLTGVILKLAETLIGQDPRPVERITANLYAKTRQAPGGLIQQAIAAIENALVDVKAKALGVPVCEMLGGPVHDQLRLYWSHCGTYRLHHAEKMGLAPVRNLDDIRKLGEHVRERGFTALKTNIFLFDGAQSGTLHARVRPLARRARAQPVAARRGGARQAACSLPRRHRQGRRVPARSQFQLQDRGLRPPRPRARAEAAPPHVGRDRQLRSGALALIRRSIATPLASCESLFGRRQFKDYLESYSMDVGIVDLPWNGILESMKIAAMAEAYEVNCAPHNFYGHMSTLMSAHFCAAIPNFRIMEIDIDDVPWKDDLVTEPPRIENGHLIVPTTPGWGADVNEAAVRKHPPK